MALGADGLDRAGAEEIAQKEIKNFNEVVCLMKRKIWYLISLTFPLLLPAFLLLCHEPVSRSFDTANFNLTLYDYFIFSAFFGGVPYFLFIIGIVVWLRHKTANEIKLASWILPVLFTPVLWFGLFLMEVLDPLHKNIDIVSFNWIPDLLIGLFALPFGYFYVLLVNGLTYLFQKLDWIRN